MKKIVFGLVIVSLSLFGSTYEVTNVSCDEKLSVRTKPNIDSHVFFEMNCNKKEIKVLECQESTNKYTWCKVSFEFYESTLVGWVYNKYIKKSVTKSDFAKSDEVKRLLKSAKAYYFGTNQVGKNYEKARKVFLKAAKQGSVTAYRYLATIYLFGHGVEVDKKEAKKWLMKAVNLDDENAEKLYKKYFLNL